MKKVLRATGSILLFIAQALMVAAFVPVLNFVFWGIVWGCILKCSDLSDTAATTAFVCSWLATSVAFILWAGGWENITEWYKNQ